MVRSQRQAGRRRRSGRLPPCVCGPRAASTPASVSVISVWPRRVLSLGTGRIGERPEIVEDRADAELFAAGRRISWPGAGSERRGRRCRTRAGIAQAPSPGIEVDAEGGDDFGRAAASRVRPVTVLGHDRPGRGGDDRRGGRDVERADPSPPVPQVSMQSASQRTRVTFSFITSAAPRSLRRFALGREALEEFAMRSLDPAGHDQLERSRICSARGAACVQQEIVSSIRVAMVCLPRSRSLTNPIQSHRHDVAPSER